MKSTSEKIVQIGSSRFVGIGLKPPKHSPETKIKISQSKNRPKRFRQNMKGVRLKAKPKHALETMRKN